MENKTFKVGDKVVLRNDWEDIYSLDGFEIGSFGYKEALTFFNMGEPYGIVTGVNSANAEWCYFKNNIQMKSTILEPFDLLDVI